MRLGLRRAFGIFILAIGLLLLLQSRGIIVGDFNNIVWAVLLGMTGAFFTARFVSNREHWWWLVPGISLIGLAIGNLAELIPNVGALLSGFFATAGIGFAFILIYLNNRINWWALIPGGVLVSMGAVTIFQELNLPGFDPSAVFFMGIGLTFLIMFVLPTPYGRLTWAILPGVLLIGYGWLVGFGDNPEILAYAGPAVLMLLGLLVLGLTLRKP